VDSIRNEIGSKSFQKGQSLVLMSIPSWVKIITSILAAEISWNARLKWKVDFKNRQDLGNAAHFVGPDFLPELRSSHQMRFQMHKSHWDYLFDELSQQKTLWFSNLPRNHMDWQCSISSSYQNIGLFDTDSWQKCYVQRILPSERRMIDHETIRPSSETATIVILLLFAGKWVVLGVWLCVSQCFDNRPIFRNGNDTRRGQVSQRRRSALQCDCNLHLSVKHSNVAVAAREFAFVQLSRLEESSSRHVI
jgi:hypothetical protein